jgi:ubiquitin-like domain-containing CTD phosphatase 1
MPLLASIGPNLWNDTDWPPYASMLLIEIHELVDGQSDAETYTSNFAFRLLYNGRILTHLVDGCHESSELCDIVHFKSKVDPIATRETDCSVPPIASVESPLSLSSTGGVALFVSLICLSSFLGSVTTYVILRKASPGSSGRRKKVDHDGAAWHSNDGGLELREGDFADEPDGT